jgi:hypothetical protein
MKPADDPKVAVIQDGDRWTAIIGDERFESFRSEADAWGFARCLCSDDAGEWDKVDLSFAMTFYRPSQLAILKFAHYIPFRGKSKEVNVISENASARFEPVTIMGQPPKDPNDDDEENGDDEEDEDEQEEEAAIIREPAEQWRTLTDPA